MENENQSAPVGAVVMASASPKERPILFSGPMVQAILEGRKTQTRRVIKPQPSVHIDELHGHEFRKRAPYDIEHPETGAIVGLGFQGGEDEFHKCPYGRAGDRLWVRETFAVSSDADRRVVYRASTPMGGGVWKPSIHMPRWASRITLEITGVRVERLQDISEEDAIAEGTARTVDRVVKPYSSPVEYLELSYRDFFQLLWESINGPDSWSANPWVWVVEFQRLG